MPSSDLTWTKANSPVNRIDEYRLFRSVNVLPSAAGFANSFVLFNTGDDLLVINDPDPPFGDTHPLTYSDTTVDFSTNFYCYRVDAYSVLVGEATGGSPQTGVGPSNIICIGTPAQPATLSGVEISDTQVDLSWVNGSDGILPVFSTCIFRSVNEGPFTLLAEVFMPILIYIDITVDLSGSNTYEYYVTSKDEANIESDVSNTVRFGFAIDFFIAIAGSGATLQRIMVSDDGEVWDQKNIIDSNWQALAFAPGLGAGAGRIVALNFGDLPNIHYSDDGGDTWTPAISTPGGSGWGAVTYSESLGLFAAISNNSNTNGNKVATSSDGITWAFVSTPAFMDSVFWGVIHWDAVNELFLCGSNATAASSADGITFTERTTPGTTQMGDEMATSPAGVSVASNPSDVANMRTLNGETWIDVPNPNGWAGGTTGIAFGAGLFVVCGGGPQGMETSPDGTSNWINRQIASPGNLSTYQSIAYSEELGLFVAVNTTNFPNQVVISVDGITWVAQDLTGNIAASWAYVLAAKRLPVVQQEMLMVENNASSPVAALSVNGSSWTSNATAFPFRLDDVAWSPSLGLYVAVGDNICITSPDGITWTERTITNQDWQTVYFSTGLSLFIGGADEAGTNQMMTSPDGVTWIDRTTANGYRCHDIVEHPTANSGSPRICAVGLNAFTNPTGNMLFSDDGITWTPTTTNPSNRVVACAYDSTLNRVVAVESGGLCNVSSDCDTWTLNINSADIGSGNSSNSSALGYSAALDQLVFVSGNGIFSSEDGGANFTLRNANDMQDVVWSSVLNRWIACNDNAPLILISDDGINWVAGFASTDTWVAIALGDEL